MNLKIFCPQAVKGIVKVNITAIELRAIIILEGRTVLNIDFFVLIENKKTNSVRMLEINQLVCKTSGEIL